MTVFYSLPLWGFTIWRHNKEAHDMYAQQLKKLSARERWEFIKKWGPEPWRYRKDAVREDWMDDLFKRPAYSRWDHISRDTECDPLYLALMAKNRPAARALLEKKGTLAKQQTGTYALLTLQWAPDLLEAILDAGPADPHYYLNHCATWRSNGRLLVITGSLLMIAAALDDLPSLELLLRRGYDPTYSFQKDGWKVARDHALTYDFQLFAPNWSVAHLPGQRDSCRQQRGSMSQ